MSVALYRKYRPKTFGEVTNQTHIKVTLQNEITGGRLGHAYLFCGPRGTGKTTVARLLAKAANCLDRQPNAEPCNKCESCLEIMEGRALDIIEMDAATHTQVDNVRESIIANSRFTPVKSKYKIFIIDEVHMLSTASFNALLKTLEEPPSHVIFILATTEIHKVPVTIVSRCQHFDFKKITLNDLVSRLRWIVGQEGIAVDDKVLTLVAKQSGGCVRDAESLLEQILSLGDKKIGLEQAELILPRLDFDLFYRLLELIVKKQAGEAITLVNKLIADGIDIGQFTDNFVEFIRNFLVYKITGNLEELSRSVEESVVLNLVKMAESVPERQLVDIIAKCLADKELFKQNFIAQLPLEMAVWELTQDASINSNIEYRNPKKSEIINSNIKKEETIVTPAQKPIEMKPVIDEASPFTQEEQSDEPLVNEKKTEETVAVERPVTETVSDRSIVSDVDLPGVMSRWGAFMSKLKDSNHAIFMSLCMAKPLKCQDGKLILGFLYDLQKKRIDDIKAKAVLQPLLREMFGGAIEIEAIIDPRLTLSDLPAQQPSARPAFIVNTDAASSLASEFGGEIVG
ncbi:MAG: DNA polymerase III subunit gamma/tau [Parcubacteria group bacterium]